MAKIDVVSIRFKQQAYRLLKNQTLELPYVFAEYVDNSLESYRVKKKMLRKANPNHVLSVMIYRNGDEIIISDNAGGIEEKNFRRAFEPGHVPEQNEGLNEFGMGLKNSSVWLADHFQVETSAIGEPVKRIVEFDYHNVIKYEIEKLKVIEKKWDINDGFTTITLTQTRAYKNWPWKKIQDTLASIYRNQLMSGEMVLNVFGEELKYKSPNILHAPPQKEYEDFLIGKLKKEPESIEWKYSFDIPLGKKRLSGFVAVLEKMSGFGFSYFRRGRVIDGAGDEKQHPFPLSGQVGSPRYKRMYGELHFDGFNVDYKKTGIIQEEELSALIDLLSTQLRSVKIDGKFYNFLAQAQNYKIPSKDNIATLTQRQQKEVEKRKNDKNDSQQKATSFRNALERIDNNKSKDGVAIKKEEALIKTDEVIEETYPISSDAKFLLRYCFKSLPTKGDLYNLTIKNVASVKEKGKEKEVDKDVVYIISGWINVDSPFFKQNLKIFEKPDTSNLFIKLLKIMMLSEAVSKWKGDETENYFRDSFNELIYI